MQKFMNVFSWTTSSLLGLGSETRIERSLLGVVLKLNISHIPSNKAKGQLS